MNVHIILFTCEPYVLHMHFTAFCVCFFFARSGPTNFKRSVQSCFVFLLNKPWPCTLFCLRMSPMFFICISLPSVYVFFCTVRTNKLQKECTKLLCIFVEQTVAVHIILFTCEPYVLHMHFTAFCVCFFFARSGPTNFKRSVQSCFVFLLNKPWPCTLFCLRVSPMFFICISLPSVYVFFLHGQDQQTSKGVYKAALYFC